MRCYICTKKLDKNHFYYFTNSVGNDEKICPKCYGR